MKTAIQIIIHDALEKARQAGELELSPFPEIVVEKPKDEKMGDFSIIGDFTWRVSDCEELVGVNHRR